MAPLIRELVDRVRGSADHRLERLPPRTQYTVRRIARTLESTGRRAFNAPALQPLVSVVVPVYNVQDFLPACLDSLVDQTYRRLQIICVDDGSPDDSIEVLRRYAGRDSRIEIIRQHNAGLGAARNVGAKRARGKYLLFLDSDDVLELDAVATYVGALRRTGSDLAVSSYRRMNDGGTWPAAYWIRQAHQRTVYATTLEQSPDILVNAVAWSKCYRRSFWERHRFRFPEGVLYEDQAVSARAYALANHFDILGRVTLNWRVRHDRSSITQQQVSLDDLRARLEAAFTSLDELAAAGATRGHDVRLAQLLGNDFPLTIKASQHAGDEFWQILADGLGRLLDRASPAVMAQVPAQHRLTLRLATAGLREETVEFVGLGHDNPKNSPALIKNGKVYVQFPARHHLGLAEDDELLALADHQLGLITRLGRARWEPEHGLTVRGWAYIDNVDATGRYLVTDAGEQDGGQADDARARPRITGVLTELDTASRPLADAHRTALLVPAEIAPDPEVTAASRHRYADYENCCFTLAIDPQQLASLVGTGRGARRARRWRLDVRTEVAGISREGTLRGLDTTGGLQLPSALLPDGQRLTTSYSKQNGLIIRLEPITVELAQADLDGRSLSLAVRSAEGFELREVEVEQRRPATSVGRLPRARVALRTEPGSAQRRATVALPAPVRGPAGIEPDGPGGPVGPAWWTVRVIGTNGRSEPIAVPDGVNDSPTSTRAKLRVTGHRNLGVVDLPPVLLQLTDVGVETDRLRLAGHISGSTDAVRLRLGAPHARREATIRPDPDGGFAVALPLSFDPWHTGERPLPVGRYTLTAGTDDGSGHRGGMATTLSPELVDRLPLEISSPLLRGTVSASRNGAELILTLLVPLAENERGARQQERMQNRLRDRLTAGDFEPGAVLFRSYFGETCSCNPLAVHRELRRRGTHHKLYWAVKDHSVAVPEGGIPVIHESAEWYRLLHDAEYYMDNMHQAIYHPKPAHQTQIQTFHGYPFKQMGQSHWAWQNRDVAHVRSYLERAAEWDFLVSPATYGTEPLVREFGFPHEVLEIGYPRNDVLQSPEAATLGAEVRDRLGIKPDQKVVLYGPTFRDHLARNDFRAAMVDFLDTAELARQLGPDWVIMVRGHAFNAREAQRLESHGTVLEVTDYPDINDLVLASDCAVLDYSSLRFDYALTGKPMLFMVPDLRMWSESSRGTLFAYEPTAPGPLLVSTEELIEKLRDLDGVRSQYAEAYATFRATYCDLDDGHAAERLVDRVFDH